MIGVQWSVSDVKKTNFTTPRRRTRRSCGTTNTESGHVVFDGICGTGRIVTNGGTS